MVPDGLTTEEVESSVVELGDITRTRPRTLTWSLWVPVQPVCPQQAGQPSWAACGLLQKQSIVVSRQLRSAIIKSKSTEAGKKMWVHMTNGLCDCAPTPAC